MTVEGLGRAAATTAAAVERVGAAPKQLDTPQQIAAFTDRWLDNRRFSGDTREAYRRDVDYWVRWNSARDGHLLTVTFVDLNEWARDMEQTLAPATVARRMSAVSSWYGYLVQLGVLASNPAEGADRPRVNADYSPTKSFGAAEAAAILTAAAAGDEHLGAAAESVATWLVDMGTRVSEMCKLDVTALGEAQGHRTVTLVGKGSKLILRPVPAGVCRVLDPYLERRAQMLNVSVADLRGPLFLDRNGRRITRHQVARLVKRLAREAGMPDWESYTPHAFRHAWNAIAKQSGAILEDRQDAMGHADPRTTRRYDRRLGQLDRDPAALVARAVSGQLQQGQDR